MGKPIKNSGKNVVPDLILDVSGDKVNDVNNLSDPPVGEFGNLTFQILLEEFSSTNNQAKKKRKRKVPTSAKKTKKRRTSGKNKGKEKEKEEEKGKGKEKEDAKKDAKTEIKEKVVEKAQEKEKKIWTSTSTSKNSPVEGTISKMVWLGSSS